MTRSESGVLMPIGPSLKPSEGTEVYMEKIEQLDRQKKDLNKKAKKLKILYIQNPLYIRPVDTLLRDNPQFLELSNELDVLLSEGDSALCFFLLEHLLIDGRMKKLLREDVIFLLEKLFKDSKGVVDYDALGADDQMESEVSSCLLLKLLIGNRIAATAEENAVLLLRKLSTVALVGVFDRKYCFEKEVMVNSPRDMLQREEYVFRLMATLPVSKPAVPKQYCEALILAGGHLVGDGYVDGFCRIVAETQDSLLGKLDINVIKELLIEYTLCDLNGKNAQEWKYSDNRATVFSALTISYVLWEDDYRVEDGFFQTLQKGIESWKTK